jgi:proliferating cell nuclear antigen
MYLKMSPQVPLIVEFPIEGLGYIRYFLAPKIEEEEDVKEEEGWKA